MKILFINPPSEHEIMGNNPRVLEEERGYNPPLGLLYISTYLRKNGFKDMKIIDAQVEELSYTQLFQKIKDFSPDIVGLTVMTFTLLDVIKTVRWIKDNLPGVKIVVGGPHTHLYPKETLDALDADFAIMGEGEHSMLMLMENMDDHQKYKKIPGLVFREGKEVIFGPPSPLIQNLDEIPYPDRTLVPYQKYNSILSSESPVTTMFTSRGCPYKCRFCDRPHLGKRFRAHSAEYVIDEMRDCEALGIKEILIYDDTFTIDRKRTLKICELYKKSGLNVRWDIRARVNTIDEEVVKALKEANCQRIHFGVEAGTEKILKVLNKGITKQQAMEAFSLCRKYKVETLAYFMIGSPEETERDILESFKFARKLKPDYLHLTILTPFPGTEIYFQGIREGLFPDYWKEFAENPREDFKPRFWEKEIPEERLRELIVKGYRSFYFRPSYILKRVSRLKSREEYLKKLKAAFKLLQWRN